MTRAVLADGEQIAFLEAVKSALGVRWDELAELCGVDRRTLFNWRQEQHLIPYATLLSLTALSHVPVPSIQQLILEENWHSRAGVAGAVVSQQTHGNPGTPEGRRLGGLLSGLHRREHLEISQRPTTAKHVDRPEPSPQLAELIGVLLGDGHLSEYSATVYLSRQHEREYAEFVAGLFQEVFGLEPTTRIDFLKSTCAVQVNSVRLVAVLQELGLRIGNKVEHQIGVPVWVLESDERVQACVRGLMDTDGGPYLHSYQSGGRTYSYVKLNFSNHSRPLLEDMQAMLFRLGFSPASDGETKVVLNRQADVTRYYAEIGTHNPHQAERMRQLVRQSRGDDDTGDEAVS